MPLSASAPTPVEPSEPDAEPPSAPPNPDRSDRPFSELTEAEQYAVLYPYRAACIRASNGLPTRSDFPPPEPELAAAIAHGASPILRALDTQARVVAAA